MVDLEARQEDVIRQAKGLALTLASIYKSPVVGKLYSEQVWASASEKDLENAPETVRAVVAAVKKKGVKKAKYYVVPSDYYDWTLLKRATILNAPSVDHLCKSLVFENTHSTAKDCSDPYNSRYYCVIVQYITKLNTDVLGKFVQSLKNPRLPNKNYCMRLAKPEVSFELTGHDKNGVSYFGMKVEMPVILSKTIRDLKPGMMFLGAGDVDWKVAYDIEEFIAVTRCFIADVSI
eukprot:comp15522_c0_seq1/m.12548 comp15522_c0_seq1/g.12548  ORF comp15522_c0_seq1/g.12548 comp15522_c0_seq1/m.12548 type:complete len:234 (-) comp15522_c0_seq1:29-730(-)